MKKSFLPLVILVAAFIVITLLNSPVLNYIPIDNRVEMQKTGIDVAQSFMQDRKANQKTGKVDYRDVQKARDQVALHTSMRSSTSVLEWEEMGPDNVGGRTRAVLIDKDNLQEFMQELFLEVFGFLNLVGEHGESIRMS